MTDKPQIDKFKELAREPGADQGDAAFEEAVKKIVHAPKPPDDDTGAKAGEARLPRNRRDD